jgi:hypothetical protein
MVLPMVTILLLAASVPFGAAEEEKKKTKEKVVTTEDLIERYGAPEPPKPGKPVADTGKPAGKAPAAGDEQDAGEVNAAKRRKEIDRETTRLRKRIASLRNPYLPRVKETEQESEAEKGMDSAQKIESIEKRIAALEAERKKLEVGP